MNEAEDDKLTRKEIIRRRDEALLRALKTPPKPHNEVSGKKKRAATKDKKSAASDKK